VNRRAVRGQRRPGRDRSHVHDRQPAGRKHETAEPDKTDHRSAVDHEAVDRV
jgi:hypothetical protein